MILRELVDNKSTVTTCNNVLFDESYDVIVAGLGSAGTYFALAASENCSVLGIEKSNTIGGMWSNGYVCCYYHGLDGGAFEKTDEYEKENRDMYAALPKNPYNKFNFVYEKLKKQNVNMCFDSVVIGIFEEDNRVRGVKALIDGKIKNISCKFLCDSTSDGHLIRISGTEYTFGRESDKLPAPFSLLTYFNYKDMRHQRYAMDMGYINQYDDKDFSDKIIKAKAKMSKKNFLRTMSTASAAGIREGLLFDGEEKLTLEDIIYERKCENPLLYIESDVDRHGRDYALGNDLFKDWYIHSNMGTTSLKFPLPIGSIIPRNKKGFITACRCTSTDTYVASAVRMLKDMYRLGECAGVAVSMAIAENKNSIADVDNKKLTDVLKERGCFNSDKKSDRGTEEKSGEIYPFEWITDTDEIIKNLKTIRPGVAMWSCKLSDKNIIEPVLIKAMESEDEMLRKNSAVTLGLLGNKIALPVLRQMIKNRTDDFLLGCRRSNQMQSIMAISLAGKLQDEEILDELLSILTLDEFNREMYHTHLEFKFLYCTVADFNMIYYQYLLFALKSIESISAKYKNEKIKTGLTEFIKNKDIISDRLLMGNDSMFYKHDAENLFTIAESIIESV